MPTYEYACRSCGHHLEVVQTFSEDPLTTCPNCGGQLRKVFGSIGIVLKGSGFYKTDSRSTPASEKTGGEGSKSDSAPAKESTSASDSKGSPAASPSAASSGSSAPAAASGS